MASWMSSAIQTIWYDFCFFIQGLSCTEHGCRPIQWNIFKTWHIQYYRENNKLKLLEGNCLFDSLMIVCVVVALFWPKFTQFESNTDSQIIISLTENCWKIVQLRVRTFEIKMKNSERSLFILWDHFKEAIAGNCDNSSRQILPFFGNIGKIFGHFHLSFSLPFIVHPSCQWYLVDNVWEKLLSIEVLIQSRGAVPI